MDTSPTPRPLTYDEKRASEAAFLGLPAHRQPAAVAGLFVIELQPPLCFEGGEVVVAHVTGDVVAIEAAGLEAGDARIE